MCNYRYPAQSFVVRHQMALAVRLSEDSFLQTDFFAEKTDNLSPLREPMPEQAIALATSEFPRTVKNDSVFKIFYKRHKYWIHPKAFFSLKNNGTIFAEGPIYEIKKPRVVPDEWKSFEHVTLKHQRKWVAIDHLHHRVDFLVMKKDGKDEKNLFGEYKALLRGVI